MPLHTDGATAFHGAMVFLPDNRFAVADVLVAEGRIAVISPAGTLQSTSPETCDIDARGATLLPGFIDAHAHPLIAGAEARTLSVRTCRNVREIQERVRDFARLNTSVDPIVGEGFELSIAEGGRFLARDLDAVVADRAVILRSNDIHTYWCNTRALQQAGLFSNSPDPARGVVDRDPDGLPAGTLREWGAFDPVRELISPVGTQEQSERLLIGLTDLHRYGVTSALDAWVDADDIDAYIRAAQHGLPLKLDVALRAEPTQWADQVAVFAGIRDQLTDVDRLSARTVKFFADGIVEGGTAAVHEPYTDTSCCGLPNWEPAELARAVSAFDRAGFEIHIHAIGDAAVSSALDAIEALPSANGDRERHPAIAHAQLVTPRDIARFAATGTTAVMQPFWAKHDRIVDELTLPRLGAARGNTLYPTATMLRAGVNVAFSSDYPISTANPLDGIAVAMTRHESGDAEKAWLPHEVIRREEAFAAFTSGSAAVNRTAHGGGRLRVDATADLVLLDGDVSTAEPAALGAMRVREVWLDGHSSLAALSARTHDRN